MRLLLSTLVLIAVSAPSFAAEDEKKIDIMNPYKAEQQKVTEKSLETNKEYNDRWYAYVEERYGGKIDRPDASAYTMPTKAKASPDAAPSKDDKEKVEAAKKLFEEYKIYELNYDPAIADLYIDDADIEVTLIHQSGARKFGTIDGKKYKENRRDPSKVQKMQFVAQYSDVEYVVEGDGVRINGKAEYNKARYNRPFKGKFTILVEPQADGKWLITEEHFDVPMAHN